MANQTTVQQLAKIDGSIAALESVLGAGAFPGELFFSHLVELGKQLKEAEQSIPSDFKPIEKNTLQKRITGTAGQISGLRAKAMESLDGLYGELTTSIVLRTANTLSSEKPSPEDIVNLKSDISQLEELLLKATQENDSTVDTDRLLEFYETLLRCQSYLTTLATDPKNYARELSREFAAETYQRHYDDLQKTLKNTTDDNREVFTNYISREAERLANQIDPKEKNATLNSLRHRFVDLYQPTKVALDTEADQAFVTAPALSTADVEITDYFKVVEAAYARLEQTLRSEQSLATVEHEQMARLANQLLEVRDRLDTSTNNEEVKMRAHVDSMLLTIGKKLESLGTNDELRQQIEASQKPVIVPIRETPETRSLRIIGQAGNYIEQAQAALSISDSVTAGVMYDKAVDLLDSVIAEIDANTTNRELKATRAYATKMREDTYAARIQSVPPTDAPPQAPSKKDEDDFEIVSVLTPKDQLKNNLQGLARAFDLSQPGGMVGYHLMLSRLRERAKSLSASDITIDIDGRLTHLNALVKEKFGEADPATAYKTFLAQAEQALASKTFDPQTQNDLLISYLKYQTIISGEWDLRATREQMVDSAFKGKTSLEVLTQTQQHLKDLEATKALDKTPEAPKEEPPAAAATAPSRGGSVIADYPPQWQKYFERFDEETAAIRAVQGEASLSPALPGIHEKLFDELRENLPVGKGALQRVCEISADAFEPNDFENKKYKSVFFQAHSAFREMNDVSDQLVRTYADITDAELIKLITDFRQAGVDETTLQQYETSVRALTECAGKIKDINKSDPLQKTFEAAVLLQNPEYYRTAADLAALSNNAALAAAIASNPAERTRLQTLQTQATQSLMRYQLPVDALKKLKYQGQPLITGQQLKDLDKLDLTLKAVANKADEYKQIHELSSIKGGRGTSSTVPTDDVNEKIAAAKAALLAHQATGTDASKEKCVKAIEEAVDILLSKVGNKANKRTSLTSAELTDLEKIGANLDNLLYFHEELNGKEFRFVNTERLKVNLEKVVARGAKLDAGKLQNRLATATVIQTPEITATDAIVVPLSKVRAVEAQKLQSAYDATKADAAKENRYGIKEFEFDAEKVGEQTVGTNGQIEVRKYGDDAYNILRIENIKDRIDLYADTAIRLAPEKNVAINALRQKYLDAADRQCQIDIELVKKARGQTEGDPAFDEAAKHLDGVQKNASRLFGAMQAELITEVKDKLKPSEPSSFKKLWGKIKKPDATAPYQKAFKTAVANFVTTSNRPNALHQMPDGSINAHTTIGRITAPSIRRDIGGVIPNFVADSTAHVNTQGNIEVDALHLRSSSLPPLGMKEKEAIDHFTHDHAVILAEEAARKVIETGEVQPGQPFKIKLQATTLVTPWGSKKEKLITKVLGAMGRKYEDETDQMTKTHAAFVALDGKTIEVEAGGAVYPVQVEITHVNIPVSLRGIPAKVVNSLTGKIPSERLGAIVAKPLDIIASQFNAYHLSSSSQSTILAEGFEKYSANQAESLAGKFKGDPSYREALKTTWKDNQAAWQEQTNQALTKLDMHQYDSPAERQALQQFIYYARVQEMYYTKEYQRGEMESYVFAAMMDRSQEMADTFVWEACKSGKDRTGKLAIFKQAFLAAERDPERNIVLGKTPEDYRYLMERYEQLSEFSVSKNATGYNSFGAEGNRCNIGGRIVDVIGSKVSGWAKAKPSAKELIKLEKNGAFLPTLGKFSAKNREALIEKWQAMNKHAAKGDLAFVNALDEFRTTLKDAKAKDGLETVKEGFVNNLLEELTSLHPAKLQNPGSAERLWGIESGLEHFTSTQKETFKGGAASRRAGQLKIILQGYCGANKIDEPSTSASADTLLVKKFFDQPSVDKEIEKIAKATEEAKEARKTAEAKPAEAVVAEPVAVAAEAPAAEPSDEMEAYYQANKDRLLPLWEAVSKSASEENDSAFAQSITVFNTALHPEDNSKLAERTEIFAKKHPTEITPATANRLYGLAEKFYGCTTLFSDDETKERYASTAHGMMNWLASHNHQPPTSSTAEENLSAFRAFLYKDATLKAKKEIWHSELMSIQNPILRDAIQQRVFTALDGGQDVSYPSDLSETIAKVNALFPEGQRITAAEFETKYQEFLRAVPLLGEIQADFNRALVAHNVQEGSGHTEEVIAAARRTIAVIQERTSLISRLLLMGKLPPANEIDITPLNELTNNYDDLLEQKVQLEKELELLNDAKTETGQSKAIDDVEHAIGKQLKTIDGLCNKIKAVVAPKPVVAPAVNETTSQSINPRVTLLAPNIDTRVIPKTLVAIVSDGYITKFSEFDSLKSNKIPSPETPIIGVDQDKVSCDIPNAAHLDEKAQEKMIQRTVVEALTNFPNQELKIEGSPQKLVDYANMLMNNPEKRSELGITKAVEEALRQKNEVVMRSGGDIKTPEAQQDPETPTFRAFKA